MAHEAIEAEIKRLSKECPNLYAVLSIYPPSVARNEFHLTRDERLIHGRLLPGGLSQRCVSFPQPIEGLNGCVSFWAATLADLDGDESLPYTRAASRFCHLASQLAGEPGLLSLDNFSAPDPPSPTRRGKAKSKLSIVAQNVVCLMEMGKRVPRQPEPKYSKWIVHLFARARRMQSHAVQLANGPCNVDFLSLPNDVWCETLDAMMAKTKRKGGRNPTNITLAVREYLERKPNADAKAIKREIRKSLGNGWDNLPQDEKDYAARQITQAVYLTRKNRGLVGNTKTKSA